MICETFQYEVYTRSYIDVTSDTMYIYTVNHYIINDRPTTIYRPIHLYSPEAAA